MIQKLHQVMLYVNDQQTARQFWEEKVGFFVKSDTIENGLRIIEIAPSEQAETSLVLHDKQTIEQMSPELDLGTPSLMFETDNIRALYGTLQNKGVTVGELVVLPFGTVFNFADDEQNYFAVKQA